MAAYEIVVIGGGAAGLAAARAAAREGASVAMVIDAPPGGDCTFTGCVPSKTLIESAHAGLGFDEAMARVHRVVAQIAATETADVLRAEGIEIVEGRGRLAATGGSGVVVDVDGVALTADHVILATGATAMLPPIKGLADVNALTSETVWDLTEAPARMGILGGGPIGCELAQAFARLGVSVTVFEMLDRLLAREEPEASAVVGGALEADGVDVRVAAPVAKVERGGTGTNVIVAGSEPVAVDSLLVAVGRRPRSADLGLEEAGVEIGRGGHIVVDAKMATTADNIWAAGDVTGLLPFTHAADEMGRIATWHALGTRMRWKFDESRVPWVTFTAPEVARVGVRESRAPRGSRVAYLPMAEVDRAISADDTSGFVKLIAGPKRFSRNLGGGVLIGATIVGPRAGEMIHEPALAVRARMFAGRLAQLSHAYPTWSVAIQQAAAQFFFELGGRQARPARRG